MLPDRVGQAHHGGRSLPAAQPPDRGHDRESVSGHAHLRAELGKAHRGHLRHRQHDEHGGRGHAGGTEGLRQRFALRGVQHPGAVRKIELARRHHRRLRRRVGEHGGPRRAVHAQSRGKGTRHLSVGHCRQRTVQHDDQHVHGELRPRVLQGHGERGRTQYVSGARLRQQALPRRGGAPRCV